jgi:DNA-binding winged helix-turn-helix (wHTH) protein/tetratricopeptide (TPR) repeat protein
MSSRNSQDFSGSPMSNHGKDLYEFGPFRLDAAQRLLSRDRRPILLQPKAFETLLVLVRNSDRVVLKEELLDAVWADTFVQESNLTQNIFVLRKALGDADDGDAKRRYIVTVPGRGYRFAEKVRTLGEPEPVLREEQPPVKAAVPPRWRASRAIVIAVLAVAALALSVLAYLHFRPRPTLASNDTVVLSEFANMTGDRVFDGTLRQGLFIQLEQSPFLNLLSDQRVAQTLSLMALPKGTRLTPELAREVCQRTGSAAVLSGYIAAVGTRYLLTLHAVNCANGEVMASTETQAIDKNHVLDALGKITAEMRTRLGESLASVQKLDAPLENVTTPSLEALQAYSLGRRAETLGRGPEAATFYQRAANLDPKFAQAYVSLGVSYFNADEASRAAENLQKAYDLREGVSEREKLGIAALYDAVVTRDFEAARKSYAISTQIYPNDARAMTNLGTVYTYLGEYAESLAAHQKAMKLNPGAGSNYPNLVIAYTHTNQLEDARAVGQEAKAHNLDSVAIHGDLYLVDFLQHDAAGMAQEAALAAQPGWEDVILYYQSDTAAYGGQFALARQLTRRAADAAARSDKKEPMAAYESEGAIREALIGNSTLAKQQASGALTLSTGRDVTAMSALAYALAGDSARPTRLADDLEKRFPQDTIVRFNLLPAIRAGIALDGSKSDKALEVLATGARYEMAQTAEDLNFVLYPVYLRGEAYLAEKQGSAAGAEFQKIINHPGLVQNELIGALAYLELGRAYSLTHDTSKAKAAYEQFFLVWKDADSDIPVLKQARVEYGKLR